MHIRLITGLCFGSQALMTKTAVVAVFVCGLMAGVAAADDPTATSTETVWAIQVNGRVEARQPIVRVGDIARPVAMPAEQWRPFARLFVALVPADGRQLTLDRQRIAESLRRRLGNQQTLRVLGPDRIDIHHRPPALPATKPITVQRPPATAARAARSRASRQAGRQATVPGRNPAPGSQRPAETNRSKQPQTEPIRRVAYQPSATGIPVPAVVRTSPDAVEPASREASQANHRETRRQAVHAVRPLRRGTILTAADVQLRPLEKEAAPDEFVQDVQAVLGQEVAGGVMRDEPLRASDVQSPTLVRRSDLVEVHVLGGSIIVRTNGRALDEGAAGDLIRVQTERPRRQLMARVAGPGLVEIVTRPQQTRSPRSMP